MKQPQNTPIVCGPLSGKKFVQGEKVIKDLIENSYLFGGNAPYVEELYEQYLEDPNSVDEKWRQYFDRLQQAPASSFGAKSAGLISEPGLFSRRTYSISPRRMAVVKTL